MSTLDAALEAVSHAAKQAHHAQQAAEHEAAELREQIAEWEAKFRREQHLVSKLKAQLRSTLQGSTNNHQQRRPSSAGSGLCGSFLPPPPPSHAPSPPPPRSSSSLLPTHPRRNTVPLARGDVTHQHTHTTLASTSHHYSPTSSESIGHRTRSDSDSSSISLTALAACLLLQHTSGSGSGAKNASIGTLTSTATKASSRVTQQHHAQDDEEDRSAAATTVSVADDGGGGGVGTTAAAAVSVALARSWAAVAHGNSSGGTGNTGGKSTSSPPTAQFDIPSSGRARFKLVAAVPRNLISNTKSSTTMSNNLVSPPSTASNSAGVTGASPSFDPGMALESIDDADHLDDTQEATWRASGSHLKLHWMSAPSAVLVVSKPAPEILPATASAVQWLLRRGVSVYVEPDVYKEVRQATWELLDPSATSSAAAVHHNNNNNTSNNLEAVKAQHAFELELERQLTTGSVTFGEEEPLSPNCEAFAEAAESARSAAAVAAATAVDLLDQFLLTWTPATSCQCHALLPPELSHRLDLVVTVGGDGTVLWACSLFGNASVPPVVPLSMGSLGFMTPFPLSRMESVLSRVTSVAHGFPLMLRHRLQCRILHAGASSTDLSTPCMEDVLVLNEVVIDRGMTASLANLQCYVDRNFVTTIQGDGLIVATPTGSTAYNLAAGGSMVHPAVPCILFTPICAHTLSSRPLVFPDHVTLRVKVPLDARGEAYCSFDGRGRHVLHPGDSVLIHVSRWPVPMVCNLDSSHDWFLSVREGLNWNRRVPQKPLFVLNNNSANLTRTAAAAAAPTAM